MKKILDLRCDGGSNAINLGAHSVHVTNNEVHTLGGIKRKPDLAMSEEEMVKEMKVLMDNKIIGMVPRQQMMDHYKNLRSKVIDAKRIKLMFM